MLQMALWWENQFGHLPVTLGKLPTVLATNAHGGLLCTGQRVKCFKFFFLLLSLQSYHEIPLLYFKDVEVERSEGKEKDVKMKGI